jgi:hypothetical protein
MAGDYVARPTSETTEIPAGNYHSRNLLGGSVTPDVRVEPTGSIIRRSISIRESAQLCVRGRTVVTRRPVFLSCREFRTCVLQHGVYNF